MALAHHLKSMLAYVITKQQCNSLQHNRMQCKFMPCNATPSLYDAARSCVFESSMKGPCAC
eukprot:6378260-Lingulodinium_polyedra.AAC.1